MIRNRKYLIPLTLCVLWCQAVSLATDYYVDATSGNDGNSGTSTSAPWRTISKVNASSLAPGDRVLLQRGRTWREQLTISRDGSSGSPIVFGVYGSGSNPVLKGSALVTGWSSAGSNRWSASLGSSPNQVFFNGTRGTMKGGTGSLTTTRDWYWSGGTLYVYSTSDPDSAYTIEASVRPSSRSYGVIHMAGRSYITVENIDVSQSASFGIYIRPASHYITLRGCDVADSLDGGIVASRSSTPTTQVTVENCSVHHNNGGFLEGEPGVATYHEGLTMEGVDGFVIRGTQVYANYMEGVNFKQGAKNGVIENSVLHDNALINQYIEGASNIQVRYNRIYNCDWNAGIELGMETSTYSNDKISIHHNLIYNNNDGVNYWAMGSVTGQIQNVSIDNNTFYNNANYALRWKSGAAGNLAGTNTFRNNIVWGNPGIQDETGGEGLSGMTISYNAFQSGISTDTSGSNAKTISNAGFANAGANDFHLTSSSPCVNAGTSVGLTRDFDGTSIPQGGAPDIGAYEYGSGGTPTTYTLTVSATNGTVTKSPNQSSYTSGTSVSLQATPNTGYTFTGWSGALTGTANPVTIVMDSNKSVTANFAPVSSTTYTLTVSATNGTVTKTPNQSSYASGTSVSLQATPNSGYTFTGWSGALTGTANPATIVMDANKSVTANFSPSSGGTTKTVGNATVFSGTTSLQIRRAVPYTMSEAGQLKSITIYHEAGSGQVLLGVYADSSGTPGSRLGVTSSTTVSSAAGWQTVALQSPVSVSSGQKIWLAWVFQNAVVIHATAGTPGRADSTAAWSGGMPTTFGSSTVGNYIYSIYATYTPGASTPTNYTLTVSATNGTVTKTPNQTSYASGTSVSLKATPNSGYTFTGWSGALTGTTNPATLVMNSNKSVTANFAASNGSTTKIVGRTTVLSDATMTATRRAASYTMAEAGRLQSISIYHDAGSGAMILAVYADSSGKPGSRLGVANATTVTNTQGWQTVALQSPVAVSSGQKIWLAWLFQNSVGIRAAAGTPGRADSPSAWSGGMPTTFGTSTVANYIYSVYATYSPTTSTAAVSTLGISAVNDTVQTASTGDVLQDVKTPKGKGPKAEGSARTPQAAEPVTDGQDQTLPVIGGGSQMPGSATTPNTMMLLRVRDAGRGINPASVTIEVDGHVVYSGDVNSSTTAYGVCVRTGTKADTMYIYQPKESSSEQVVVAVNARDLAGNVMPEQTYLFDTRTIVSGVNQSVAPEQAGTDQGSVAEKAVVLDQSNLAQRRPAVTTDGKGNTWSAWQAGDVGQRQIYVSRQSGGTETSGDTIQVTQGEGDHCNPAIAVDGAGVLHVVWQESTRGNWDVCTSVSTDGKAWSSPKAIIDTNDNQVNPAIAASRQAAGLVAVTWQDDRAGSQDVYMATSTDAFMTAEVRAVTSDDGDQTDPTVVVDGEDAIFMRWTDTRNDLVTPADTAQEQ